MKIEGTSGDNLRAEGAVGGEVGEEVRRQEQSSTQTNSNRRMAPITEEEMGVMESKLDTALEVHNITEDTLKIYFKLSTRGKETCPIENTI